MKHLFGSNENTRIDHTFENALKNKTRAYYVMGLLKDEMPKEMEIIRSFLQEKDEYRNRFSYEKSQNYFGRQ